MLQRSWQVQRSGLLTATARLVAQGKTVDTATATGTLDTMALRRFGKLRPLTTALMVANRSDPAVESLPDAASDKECAVALAMTELLPVIEAVMVRQMKAELAASGGSRISP